MSDEQDDTALEKRIRLPEPDVKNITVLTENLPNEPVLPWHRFDSPWLNREGEDSDSTEGETLSEEDGITRDEHIQQLSLELETTILTERVVLPDDDSPADASLED